MDEAGFYLLPMVVRTYAPRGQTPVLRVPLTRDHVSAIGAITPEGRIFMQMQEQAYKAVDVVRFLRVLLRKISGQLLVIWDGSPIHRADVIKQFLASPMGKRVHLERLPGYAPELNPQEGVWNAAQTSRTQESLLPGSGSLTSGTCSRQRAFAPPANHPSTLFFSRSR